MHRHWTKYLGAAVVAASVSAASSAQAAITTALSLVVDVSGSVDTPEFELQRDGYANAFSSGAITTYLENLGTAGDSVVVQLIYFSSDAVVAVDWTELDSAADSLAFAAAISAAARPGTIGNLTGIGNAMALAISEIQTNYDSVARRVIDVSGDGQENNGGNPAAQRNIADADGIVVNSLAILTDDPNLDVYYAANVTSPGGTTYVANDFADFSDAVNDKIVQEITGGEVPEPATVLIWSVLGAAFAGYGWRRQRSA